MPTSSDATLDRPFHDSFEHLPHVACYTLYTRNGRVGCGTTDRSTQIGSIVDWNSVLSDSSGSSSSGNDDGTMNIPPYVAVMDEVDYTKDNVDALLLFSKSSSESSTPLQGILVLNSTATITDTASSAESGESSIPTMASPAPQTPRGDDTPSADIAIGGSYAWNPMGDALTIQDYYGLPTAYVADVSVASYLFGVATEQGRTLTRLRKKGKKNLQDDQLLPSIVAEFNLYMGGNGIDSSQCLAWNDVDGTWNPKCLPLGGNSIWALAGSPDIFNEEEGDQKANDGNDDNQNNNGARSTVLVATSIDTTSMFHDASPGANAAASNILTLLMTAKLLGTVSDDVFDSLPHRIVLAFFQGESYGYLGSRLFLRDLAYPGFACQDDMVPSAPNDIYGKSGDNARRIPKACLSPLRANTDFTVLGANSDIAGMITVDQVGVLDDRVFYAHGGDENNDDGDSYSNILQQLSTDYYSVSASSAEGGDDDNDGSPLPPTPLSSLLQLSGGNIGGAVLAGYDATFVNEALYQSHLDRNDTRPVDLKAVAAAATILARAALAAAYKDDEDNNNDDENDIIQFVTDTIAELDPEDETFLKIANCLLVDGNCNAFLNHGRVERTSNRELTGIDLGLGTPLGNPPNYYVSIYNSNYGQGFVQVNNRWFGSYVADDLENGKPYGENPKDTFLLRPSLLETAIRGYLDDFLGRGSSSNDENEDENDSPSLAKCQATSDCSSVSYCASQSGDYAICTGEGYCVCSRARYHPAYDESIVPSPNNSSGYFIPRTDNNDDDEEMLFSSQSPMYTEPYWSMNVGVRVYRKAGVESGRAALFSGILIALGTVTLTIWGRQKLIKEKLY